MSVIVNLDAAAPEVHPVVTVHRLLRRDGPTNVGVGVASWSAPPPGFDPVAASEAHDVPEVHYVTSGQGVLFEDGVELPVRAGDAILTSPGRPHVLWATGDGPLVTVYVAIGLGAFGSTP